MPQPTWAARDIAKEAVSRANQPTWDDLLQLIRFAWARGMCHYRRKRGIQTCSSPTCDPPNQLGVGRRCTRHARGVLRQPPRIRLFNVPQRRIYSFPTLVYSFLSLRRNSQSTVMLNLILRAPHRQVTTPWFQLLSFHFLQTFLVSSCLYFIKLLPSLFSVALHMPLVALHSLQQSQELHPFSFLSRDSLTIAWLTNKSIEAKIGRTQHEIVSFLPTNKKMPFHSDW